MEKERLWREFGGGEKGGERKRERESIKYKHNWGELGGKNRIFGTRRREFLLWSIKWILFRMNCSIYSDEMIGCMVLRWNLMHFLDMKFFLFYFFLIKEETVFIIDTVFLLI